MPSAAPRPIPKSCATLPSTATVLFWWPKTSSFGSDLQEAVATLPIRLVVLLSDEAVPEDAPVKMLNFSQLLEVGKTGTLQPVTQKADDLATLIYTSGTTGKPKGVIITHANLLHQIQTLGAVVQPAVGDRVLGLLPTWHTFGRTAEYLLYSQGCTQTYTSIRHIKADFKQVKPHYMVGVPRVWESIYEGVQKQFREQPASKQRLINTLMLLSRKYVQNRRTANGLSLDHPNTSALRRFGSRYCLLSSGPVMPWPKSWCTARCGRPRGAVSSSWSVVAAPWPVILICFLK
jgi:long-chain acyl-CoA synthetase